ncbi:hypothetical protein BBOV_III008640 [Babesia bovis T2Bo]|uniref:GYF domain-containing protein n=1 Tax=Babesia bovis TaxID=5865 RepID=A7APE0_BABBO|nr:hypothetical protein BBOV_III008640 [Babesia bovis T2Bo]EDO08424.1 hypothetical protein BBOV_III008640 [Babesia bovis T2Bo]|eukprot:XP_001611992.1 hypothetical protein [Babesia bovis T2Bo]
MYLPHEIHKIKDKRRLKRLGIKEDVELTSIDAEGLQDGAYFASEDAVDQKDYQYGIDTENNDENIPDHIPIEPFNMRREMAEGAFDDDGTYVERDRKMTSTNRSLNRDEGEDPWITSLEEQSQLTSKGMYSDFYQKRPLRVAEGRPDLIKILESTPMIDVIKRLINLLEPGETPIDALKIKTYNQKKHILPGFRKGRSARVSGAEDVTDTSDPHVTQRGEMKPNGEPKDNSSEINDQITLQLNKMDVSDLSHVLTVMWQNVYYMKKEEIQTALYNVWNKSGRKNSMYEFRWIKNKSEVYGPNSEQELWSWIAYDYISDDNPVELRLVNSDSNTTSNEWVYFKKSPFYRIMDVKESVLKPSQDDSDSDDDDDAYDNTFSKRQRKDELIGIKHENSQGDDNASQGSDDEPDVE